MNTPWRTPGNPELANTVHRWMPSDTEVNWLGRGKPSVYDDTSFDYRYNELGFRCDSMSYAQGHEHRILFAGCSVTEGIGLPVEATWGHRMLTKLRDHLGDPCMPYWCVARGGASQDWIARQLCIMLPIIRPQVVIAHLPDPMRRELWWRGELRAWAAGDAHDDELNRSVLGIWDDDQVVQDSQKNIMLIHRACQSTGTLLRWHMWLHGDYDADRMYRRIKEGLPDEVQACHYDTSPGGEDIARDGMHGGPISHSVFADALWAEIGPDLLLKFR